MHVSTDSWVDFSTKYTWNDSGHRYCFVGKHSCFCLASVIVDLPDLHNNRNIHFQNVWCSFNRQHCGIKSFIHASKLILWKHSTTITCLSITGIMVWRNNNVLPVLG